MIPTTSWAAGNTGGFHRSCRGRLPRRSGIEPGAHQPRNGGRLPVVRPTREHDTDTVQRRDTGVDEDEGAGARSRGGAGADGSTSGGADGVVMRSPQAGRRPQGRALPVVVVDTETLRTTVAT